MIDYGKPASNQMQLDGLGVDGGELMAEARMWVGLHFSEWCWYKDFARQQCANGGKASPNFCKEAMRNRFGISIKNALAPCLARIAMEEDPSLQFRLARSKADGFTTACL